MFAKMKNYSLMVPPVICALILLSTSISFADTTDMKKDPKSDLDSLRIKTVSDAEEMISAYFKINDINVEIGSEEYVDYLTDILMYEADEGLKKLNQYEDFKIYASEYLCELNNPKLTVIKEGNYVVLNGAEQRKTIAAIEKEAMEEHLITDSETSPTKNVLASKGYSDAKAVEYARRWAKTRNPLYKSYGADCTNYVSQCVKHGGKSMTKPSPIPKGVKGTTKHWYSVRYEEWHTNHCVYRWKESSSFINVGDFYSYWKNKGIKTVSYSSKAKLQNGAAVGDVVQLKNGNLNFRQ